MVSRTLIVPGALPSPKTFRLLSASPLKLLLQIQTLFLISLVRFVQTQLPPNFYVVSAVIAKLESGFPKVNR